MSGVACATPVTPSLPSSRLGARLPVGEWLPRADGTSEDVSRGRGSVCNLTYKVGFSVIIYDRAPLTDIMV